MEETETELTCTEQEALGAEFITVELDTQPIEYEVKWAEVGSKFTIACVKRDLDEAACFTSDQMVKVEPDETFFVPYEAVYPECDDVDPDLIVTHEEKVGSDLDFNDDTEAGNSQLCEEEDVSDICWEKEVSHARTYNCRFCGKSYSHSSSLARHLHVHSDGSSLSSSKGFSKLCASKKSLQCNLRGAVQRQAAFGDTQEMSQNQETAHMQHMRKIVQSQLESVAASLDPQKRPGYDRQTIIPDFIPSSHRNPAQFPIRPRHE